MTKFDILINKQMKLYEAGLPTITNQNPLSKKSPQTPTQQTPPDTGSGMGANQQQQQAQSQTTQQPQQPQQTKIAQTQFNPQQFETMVQSIVQHANNPEAQKILQKYMQQNQSGTTQTI